MTKTCSICTRSDRAEIENALLNAPPTAESSIDDISKAFEVDVTELKTHAMFHTPLGFDVEEITKEAEPKACLSRKMRLREVDILSEMNSEYLVTLKAMGRRINRITGISSIDEEDREKQVAIAKLLTKPMVELYIGIGGEIRNNVKLIADIDKLINGPAEQDANSGLIALANAIAGSKGDYPEPEEV